MAAVMENLSAMETLDQVVEPEDELPKSKVRTRFYADGSIEVGQLDDPNDDREVIREVEVREYL